MNRQEIEQILPHRPPMLLVDEAEIMEDNTVRARYTVRGDEWFLKGHFPGRPIVPGVIQCEILAQAGGLAVMSKPEYRGMIPVFAGMRDVKFRRMVVPGDVLDIECAIQRIMMRVGFGKGTIHVNGELALSAEISFSIVPGEA